MAKYYRMSSKAEMDDYCFSRQIGDFSIRSAEAFEKHLERLDFYSKQYKDLNGRKMPAIISQERLWYGLYLSKSYNMKEVCKK